MDYSGELICIRHCGKTIFAYDVLIKCPMCGASLGDVLENTPFSLPCPFVRAYQYPCSVVLKPSSGDFLSNLHIALISSTGTTVEFDSVGVRKTPPVKDVSKDDWSQCILVAQVPEAWYDRWDEVLEQVSTDTMWRRETYHEDTHNCYTFVLNFLKTLAFAEYSDYCNDKLSFCEKVITPKTQNAAKYITIHRRLQHSEYYIEE